MGRSSIEIDKDELREKLEELGSQHKVAEHFGVSQPTISNKIREYEIQPEVQKKTQRRKSLEYPDYSWDEVKHILFDIEEKTEESIGYDEVNIEIKTDIPLKIIPLGDFHVGARHVFYRRLYEVLDEVKLDPQTFCTLDGDYADNYNTSSYKAGQIEQQVPIQIQKPCVKTIIKGICQESLGIINGCHDEWSYFNDGFDFAQYLANESNAYYMGHKGIINLKVGDIDYRIFMCHNTFRNSTMNPGHGLGSIDKEAWDFDIGIAAHVHQPHMEQRVIRGELKTLIICGSVKAEDRHASKCNFPPLLGCTPGIILNPRKFEVIGHIDYRTLTRFL